MKLIDFLAHAAAAIRVHGYLSKGKAKREAGYATADRAKDAMAGWGDFEVTEKDRARAKAALEAASEILHERTSSSYEDKLLVIVSGGPDAPLEGWETGYAASLFGFLARAKKDAERAATSRSEHFGRVKERLELEATVVFLKTISGYYGDSDLIKFETADGNAAVWFTSSSHNLEEGDAVRIKGTVKGHDDYKGIAQTRLSRVKVLEKLPRVAGDREVA